MDYYVYIIKSKKDNSLYTGYTSNMKERLKTHNNKKVSFTRNKAPFKLVYLERCVNLEQALKRERFLKSSKAKNLKNSLRACSSAG